MKEEKKRRKKQIIRAGYIVYGFFCSLVGIPLIYEVDDMLLYEGFTQKEYLVIIEKKSVFNKENNFLPPV